MQCRRPGFYPWVGKIPGGGHVNPLQFSCLENPVRLQCMSVAELDMTESQHSILYESSITSFFCKVSSRHNYISQNTFLYRKYAEPYFYTSSCYKLYIYLLLLLLLIESFKISQWEVLLLWHILPLISTYIN